MPRHQGLWRRGPSGTHSVLSVGLRGPQAPQAPPDKCNLGRRCDGLTRTRPESYRGLTSAGPANALLACTMPLPEKSTSFPGCPGLLGCPPALTATCVPSSPKTANGPP